MEIEKRRNGDREKNGCRYREEGRERLLEGLIERRRDKNKDG